MSTPAHAPQMHPCLAHEHTRPCTYYSKLAVAAVATGGGGGGAAAVAP